MSGISNYTLNQKISNLQGLIQSVTLDAVLTSGNDAGGQSITNLNDVALTTINGGAYPPAVGSDTLQDVLTAGDDAGGLDIFNLNDLTTITINGSAYPPPAPSAVITDTNTNATYYPVFVDGGGSSVVLRADVGTTPISINPNTGEFNVVDTLKLNTTTLAVGKSAGQTTQGAGSVAVGVSAGQTTQGKGCVAVGNAAGTTTQGNDAVAVGRQAGQTTQGANAIAIGYLAGNSNQTAGSICLNASGVALNPAVAGCFIDPIRADATEQLPLQYNSTTKEVSNFNWSDLLTPTSYNPILRSSSGSTLTSGNYNVRVGYYIQLGKIVWFEVRILISGKGGLGTATEDIQITLPITASSLTDLTQSLNVGNIVQTTTNIVSAFANIPSGGQDYVVFPIKETAGTTTANLEVGDISSTFQIRFGGFYFTD